MHILEIKIPKIKHVLRCSDMCGCTWARLCRTGMQQIPTFRRCMIFQDPDAVRKVVWQRTETVSVSVMTCAARLRLFQFPVTLSLRKSPLPNALRFGFLLFLPVLLILLWNYWKGSTSTHCSRRQGTSRSLLWETEGGGRWYFPLDNIRVWIRSTPNQARSRCRPDSPVLLLYF